MAFLETGAFVGLIAPGEFTVIIGGVVAGQGEIDIVPLIGLVWVCCVARRHRELLHRPQARPRVPRQARPEGADHDGAAGAGRGLLRPPRRQDDPDRPLHRPRARARAVRRRLVGMRYRRFMPFSILGTGLWATTFSLLGFFFYRSFEQVAERRRPRDARVRHARRDRSSACVWAYRRLRERGGAPQARGLARPPGAAAAAAARSRPSCGRCGGGVLRPVGALPRAAAALPVAADHAGRPRHRADHGARGRRRSGSYVVRADDRRRDRRAATRGRRASTTA